MRRKLVFVFVVVAILVAALPVFAVKYGTPDNGEHPYVGLVVFYDDNWTPLWRCTGTMISDRVMLTAGHCPDTAPGGSRNAAVYFDEQVSLSTGYPFTGGYRGVGHSGPQWQGGLYLPDTGDVGVVILDVAPGLGYASMAPAGTLDSLATRRGRQNTTFLVVGYGLQSVKPQLSQFRYRLKANVQLVNLTSQLTDGYNLQTSNNPGQGTGPGGTCFGDSGGAIFYNGQIVAVNSFVTNENCAGSSFGYRTDRQAVIDWVNSYVTSNPAAPAGADDDQ